jgi:hypothetical protein
MSESQINRVYCREHLDSIAHLQAFQARYGAIIEKDSQKKLHKLDYGKIVGIRSLLQHIGLTVLKWCQPSDLEYQLAEQIIPFPIDQRYGQDEMDYILTLI